MFCTILPKNVFPYFLAHFKFHRHLYHSTNGTVASLHVHKTGSIVVLMHLKRQAYTIKNKNVAMQSSHFEHVL